MTNDVFCCSKVKKKLIPLESHKFWHDFRELFLNEHALILT